MRICANAYMRIVDTSILQKIFKSENLAPRSGIIKMGVSLLGGRKRIPRWFCCMFYNWISGDGTFLARHQICVEYQLDVFQYHLDK